RGAASRTAPALPRATRCPANRNERFETSEPFPKKGRQYPRSGARCHEWREPVVWGMRAAEWRVPRPANAAGACFGDAGGAGLAAAARDALAQIADAAGHHHGAENHAEQQHELHVQDHSERALTLGRQRRQLLLLERAAPAHELKCRV